MQSSNKTPYIMHVSFYLLQRASIVVCYIMYRYTKSIHQVTKVLAALTGGKLNQQRLSRGEARHACWSTVGVHNIIVVTLFHLHHISAIKATYSTIIKRKINHISHYHSYNAMEMHKYIVDKLVVQWYK